MHHDPQWATFNAAYINELVEFHVENAVVGEPTEDGLIKFWSHMGMMSDPRASSDMVPDEVWREMPPDPEIEDLERRRAELKGVQFQIHGRENEKEIRDLGKQIRNKKGLRKKNTKTGYRKYYFRNRPTWDIERQFSGEAEEEEGEVAYVAPPIELHIPERAELADLQVNQPEDLDDEELCHLRIRCVELMTALNYKRETAKRRRIQKRVQANVLEEGEFSGSDPFPLLMGKTQCPRCIGDARQSYEERTFPNCRTAVMNDHFEREHLMELEEMERENLIFCEHPKCKEEGVKLKHLDHFRNHVESVHGVKLLKRSRKA